MDEPLSNLDALLRMQMRAELKALLHELGTTTIYVTHDQVGGAQHGRPDRRDEAGGQIVQVDSPLEVYDNPADKFVGGFVGTPPMNFLAARISAEHPKPVVRVSWRDLPDRACRGRAARS